MIVPQLILRTGDYLRVPCVARHLQRPVRPSGLPPARPQATLPPFSPLYGSGSGLCLCGSVVMVLRGVSPETCSIEFVPVSGQTSASSRSSPGSPFSAGSLTFPVSPEVESKERRGDKGESHEAPEQLKARRRGGKREEVR